MRTYDIINAGPRNRFTANGRVVSNSGRLFQPQNLIRTPGWFDGTVQEIVIAAFKEEGAVELIWDNVIELCAFAVRGAVVAGEGRKFVISDLSNIEGRVNAWLAFEEWKLAAFREYDAGIGPDLYKLAAAKILGKQPEDVTKDERQKVGKVSELACGYQGWVGAFRQMGGAAVDAMTDEEIAKIAGGWRDSHPCIKRMWYNFENAARAALRNQGESFAVDLVSFDAKVDAFGVQWLRMRLPSGRYLCYMEPSGVATTCPDCKGQGVVVDEAGVFTTCENCEGQGEWGTNELSYMGVDQYTRQWKRQKTYGGKLVENCVQAVARDVFFHGMQLAEADGFRVVLRVHDELVCEVPDTDEYTVDRLSQLMATNPPWAAGLPLAAAGFEARRYRKGD